MLPYNPLTFCCFLNEKLCNTWSVVWMHFSGHSISIRIKFEMWACIQQPAWPHSSACPSQSCATINHHVHGQSRAQNAPGSNHGLCEGAARERPGQIAGGIARQGRSPPRGDWTSTEAVSHRPSRFSGGYSMLWSVSGLFLHRIPSDLGLFHRWRAFDLTWMARAGLLAVIYLSTNMPEIVIDRPSLFAMYYFIQQKSLNLKPKKP